MDELEDLGVRFGRDKFFCFDHIIIKDIIFDDTSDVTLYCYVPYFGQLFFANFGLTFDQLNTVLRSTRSDGAPVATAIAEKLKGDIEIPSVIDLEQVFGRPLTIDNCILYTTLYDITEDDLEDDDEMDDLGMEEMEDHIDIPDDDAEDEEEIEAYAFLVEDIIVKDQDNNLS